MSIRITPRARRDAERIGVGLAAIAIGASLNMWSAPGFFHNLDAAGTPAAVFAIGCVFFAAGAWAIVRTIDGALRNPPAPGSAPQVGATELGTPHGTRVPGFGFVPHPLDVDISVLPVEIVQVQAGGRSVRAYLASCPDGCGVLAWTDQILPFNAASPDEAETRIRASYE